MARQKIAGRFPRNDADAQPFHASGTGFSG